MFFQLAASILVYCVDLILLLVVSVCCKQGSGGPIELFDGPIEGGRLLFEDGFVGTTRKAFTFTRQGDAVPTSSCFQRASIWGGFVVSFALVTLWML